MSLILDALRKADAERQQGQVPGLHAQPTAALPSEPPGRERTNRWRWPFVAVAVFCVSTAAAWFLLTGEPSQPSASPAPRQAVAPPARAPSSVTSAGSPGETGAATGGAAPPAVYQSPASTRAAPPTESADVAEPAPWPARESRKTSAGSAANPPASRGSPPPSVAGAKGGATAPGGAPVAGVAATPTGTQAAPAPTTQTAPPPTTATASAPAILEREQLPQEMRAALPPLVVSGAIYSPRAQDRTLIVDGRLYRENDAIAPNLSLERIEQKSAIFRYRGYRFQILF